MRPMLAAIFALAALSSIASAAEPADPAAAEAIRRSEDVLARADAARDASAAIGVYADDAIVFLFGSEPVRGRSEVRGWLAGRIAGAPKIVREQYETATLEVCGDLAVETGTVAVEEEAGDATRTRRTPRLAVWKRQADGAWKIEKEAWGSRGETAPAVAALPAAPAAAPAAAPPPAAVPEPPRMVVVAPPSDVVPIPDPRGLSDGFVRTVGDHLRSRAAKIRSFQASGGGEALRAAISKADRELEATIRDVGWIDVARFGVATSCDAAFIVSVSGDAALVRSAVPWMKDLATNPEGSACYAGALAAYEKLPPR